MAVLVGDPCTDPGQCETDGPGDPPRRLVVAIDGKASRKVVEHGIDALKAVWHRGAVDADGKTGDGAGIHVQIPVPFFYDQIRRTGHEPRMDELIAVGQVFLPRTDFGAQERCRTIVETEVLRMGYYIYGWRHVPVNIDVLGDKANATFAGGLGREAGLNDPTDIAYDAASKSLIICDSFDNIVYRAAAPTAP